jgi:uncharacterized membrane protein YdjX (TVP38/TMEM64 family)
MRTCSALVGQSASTMPLCGPVQGRLAMTKIDDIERSAALTNRRRLLLGIALIVVIAVGLSTLPLQHWLENASGWVTAHPVSGQATYAVLTVIATVLMVPGSILIMCGGYLFGLHGVPVISLSLAFGAGVSARLCRTLMRGWLARRFASDPRFMAIDNAVAKKGFAIVALTRLSLLFPFNLLNVIYGLTRLPLLTMALATWLGMMPALVLYTYLGAAAQNLDQIFGGRIDTGWSGKAALVISLLLVALVTFIVHRTATRALKRELQDAETGHSEK